MSEQDPQEIARLIEENHGLRFELGVSKKALSQALTARDQARELLALCLGAVGADVALLEAWPDINTGDFLERRDKQIRWGRTAITEAEAAGLGVEAVGQPGPHRRISFGGEVSLEARTTVFPILHRITGDRVSATVSDGRVIWEVDLRAVTYGWPPEEPLPAEEMEELWRTTMGKGKRVKITMEPVDG